MRSRRASRTIDALWAVITVDREGKEGIVRRDTPFGTQPLITDDHDLATGGLLELAQAMFPGSRLRVIRFVRHDAKEGK
jgi:hypothetical protein